MTVPLSSAATDPVRMSALLATIAYAIGIGLLLRIPTTSVAHWGWLIAWLLALLHTLIAFGVAHHWSHTAAIAHTQAVSGFGFGVFINELFVLIWLIDALWRLIHRPPRVWTWLAHSFLAFIMFNAAIVFGTWPARVIGVVCLAGFLAMSSRRFRAPRSWRAS